MTPKQKQVTEERIKRSAIFEEGKRIGAEENDRTWIRAIRAGKRCTTCGFLKSGLICHRCKGGPEKQIHVLSGKSAKFGDGHHEKHD